MAAESSIPAELDVENANKADKANAGEEEPDTGPTQEEEEQETGITDEDLMPNGSKPLLNSPLFCRFRNWKVTYSCMRMQSLCLLCPKDLGQNMMQSRLCCNGQSV